MAEHSKDAPAFDPEALRERYRAERDKRLRRDGLAQYGHARGEMLEDPYVEPGFTRPPIKEELDVLVIGGGMGGLYIGARLREAGVEDFRVIDKAGDFGGVWYWNRYPGVACDTESYIYIPLLDELGYVPSEKYAKGPEILAHCRRIGEKYRLYDRALFQTAVLSMRWDEARLRWIVSTDRGDEIAARFVTMSPGLLSNPKLPAVPGIETFRGKAFHSSRWDYDYTGGDTYGNLEKLAGKRVGVIGTGASAVQSIPHVGQWAKHLYVFQRTPAAIPERGNRLTDPDWAKSLAPGWQKRRMDNFNDLTFGYPVNEDLVADGWTEIMVKAGPALPPDQRQPADFMLMEAVRARVDDLVEDPATAAALKPYYNTLCKRPCFHDAYLQTFNRPNVTLVDTDGLGVERVTETGVVVAGQEYELDCLIYATGFEWITNWTGRNSFEVIGRGGVLQTEAWKDGVSSYFGMHFRNFPNYFVMGSSQQPSTINFPHILEEMSRHVAWLIKRCLDEGIAALEPTVEAETTWVEEHMAMTTLRRGFYMDCTPGYYNDEGQVSQRMARNSPWGNRPQEFIKIIEAWRAEGAFAGLEVRRETVGA
jgi:cation diffusion facilitator CzcD-associated flavoprotein CzcO